MSIKDMKTIKVLNYNPNCVVVSTRNDSYKIEAAVDSETPTEFPLTLDDVIYINADSVAFKKGLLRFPKDIEKEMYEDYLNIHNWEDLITNKEIENILIHPTVEGLTKILDIKDDCVFDRVKMIFVKLKNITSGDISLKTQNLINARADELRREIRKTRIEIKPKDLAPIANSEEVDALKLQNENLQKEMAEMKALMEQMMKSQTEAETKVISAETTSKKAGRPKKS